MASMCSSSPLILIQKSGLMKKPIRRSLVMLQHNQSAMKKTSTPTLQIRSSITNKVFDDPCTGIVCYRDDKGEIICEGYDEGPRINQGFSKTDCYLRDNDIIELLQQNWLQIIKGDGDKEDLNWNFFNTF